MNADLRARILAEAKRTPSPTRAEHGRRVMLVVVAGIAAIAALFFLMGGVKQGARPSELVAFATGYALLGAAMLTRLSGARHGSMLPRPSAVLLGLCFAAAPVLAVGAIVAASIWPGAAEEAVPARTDLACSAMTVAQGVLPLVVLVLLRRGSDPVHPTISGAALGMAAGAWSTTMAYLRCPHAAASHCVIAHVLPALVFVAAGALLGRVLLSARR